jgi:DNA-binding MarR family transcriptional regulator
MHKAAGYLAGLVRADLAGERLTAGQLLLIVAVAGSEGPSYVEIADITQLDRTTVADIVPKLQRRGWIERRRKPEKPMSNSVSLTKKGRAVLEQVVAAAERAELGLPGSGWEGLLRQLRKAAEASRR